MSFVYKGLKANLEKLLVTDQELDRQLVRLQQQTPRTKIVKDRAAQMGDEVVLDYAGFCEGKQFEGGTAKEQALTLGSGMFIPGFEAQLVGCRAGSDVVVKVTFPADYRATELAGKPAEFRCHIVELHEKSAYELDDTFAKEVGGCQSLDEMKTKLRASLQAYYDEQAEMDVQDKLMRQAAATLDYAPTEEELQKGIDAQIEVLKAQLARKGLTLEAYCQFTGADEAQLREDAKPDAESALRIQEAAARIAGLENLTASDEDIASELDAICRQNNMTMEQLRPHVNAEFEASVAENIRMKKAIALVRKNADVTVVQAAASKN